MRCVIEYEWILATKNTFNQQFNTTVACDKNFLLCILYIIFQLSVYSNMKFNILHRRTFTCALYRFLDALRFTSDKMSKKSIIRAAQLSTGCALRCTWIRMSTKTTNRGNIDNKHLRFFSYFHEKMNLFFTFWFLVFDIRCKSLLKDHHFMPILLYWTCEW